MSNEYFQKICVKMHHIDLAERIILFLSTKGEIVQLTHHHSRNLLVIVTKQMMNPKDKKIKSIFLMPFLST
jgi:hypothetical protein